MAPERTMRVVRHPRMEMWRLYEFVIEELDPESLLLTDMEIGVRRFQKPTKARHSELASESGEVAGEMRE